MSLGVGFGLQTKGQKRRSLKLNEAEVITITHGHGICVKTLAHSPSLLSLALRRDTQLMLVKSLSAWLICHCGLRRLLQIV